MIKFQCCNKKRAHWNAPDIHTFWKKATGSNPVTFYLFEVTSVWSFGKVLPRLRIDTTCPKSDLRSHYQQSTGLLIPAICADAYIAGTFAFKSCHLSFAGWNRKRGIRKDAPFSMVEVTSVWVFGVRLPRLRIDTSWPKSDQRSPYKQSTGLFVPARRRLRLTLGTVAFKSCYLSELCG